MVSRAPLFILAGTALTAAALWPRVSGAALPSTPSRAETLEGLRDEYRAAWDAAQIRPERLAAVERLCDVLLRSRERYETAGAPLGVPWHVVACLHALEGGGSRGDFSRHLLNGDPLTGRTVHVPAGRPVAPPAAGEGEAYAWEEGAREALARWRAWSDWSVPGTLYQLERYNGMGTRRRGVWSPYLWSFTTLYSRGKFVSDGVWDPSAVSAQVGAAAILKVLSARGLIDLR